MPFIETVHDLSLGHASHVIGDEATGVAIVVDPARDPAPYETIADERGVRIAWVFDTHAHNDYLSGLEALRGRGARAITPVGAPTAWPAELGWHWRRIRLGRLELELLHTPGHAPEHTALLVHGLGRAGLTLLSGGSLLIGDVGRPDLLGDGDQQQHAARAMVHSMLDVVLDLPDDTEVRPTHVGGSLCAGAIQPGLVTSIGEQRRTNPALRAMLADPEDLEAWFEPDLLPPMPPSWPASRARNLAGVPAPRVEASRLPRLEPDAFARRQPGAFVLDVRDADEFTAAHVHGSVHVPLAGSFPVWAGATAHGEKDVVLVASDARQAQAAARAFARVHVGGAIAWLHDADFARLSPTALDTGGIEPASAQLVGEVRDGIRRLVDVRNPAEVLDRPLHGADAIPAAALLRDPRSAPSGPLVIACLSGFRAAVVASALRRAGHRDVIALDGSPFEVRWDAVSARALQPA